MTIFKTERSLFFDRFPIVAFLILAFACMMPSGLFAFDDVPDYKFLSFPCVPRDGARAAQAGEYEGDIRNIMETVVETYWKETSYHEASTNFPPFSVRGFYPDTKTYGYVLIPWSYGPVVRADTWISVFDPRIIRTDRRPVTFAGEHNWETGDPFTLDSPGQLYNSLSTVGLVDGIWTPGERFNDVNGNGVWDPFTPGSTTPPTTNIVVGENWWDSSNTLRFPTNWPPGPPIVGMNGVAGGAPDTRGEYYADYNRNTPIVSYGTNAGFSQVVWPAFDPNVTIYVADPNNLSNRVVTLSEFDLTPENNTPSMEGDFAHKQIFDPNAVGPFATNDIPTNGTFDFQMDIIGLPQIFTPPSLADTTTAKVVTYSQFVDTNGNVYVGTQAGPDGAKLVTVTVPVYQSFELWGLPVPGLPGATAGAGSVWAPGSVTVIPGVVVPPIPEEPFEDFISWWVPFAGADGQGRWLGGVFGLGAGMGGPVTVAHMPNLGLDNAISGANYANYIRNNYPGNVAALLARAGNGTYDGPDNWCERVANKMQIKGFVANTSTPPPTFWDPRNVFGSNWKTWWTTTFGSAVPTTFGSPFNISGNNWWPGNEIPNCAPWAPVPGGAGAVAGVLVTQGDGLTLGFAGNLPNQNIRAGTLSIIGGTWTFTDNGSGTLSGSAGAVGTINYVTGAWTLTFQFPAPALGDNFTASYQIPVFGWIPALNSTWGYDSPREFQDLPSSIYHYPTDFSLYKRGNYANDPFPTGGDLRLGEVTSHWSDDVYGQDLGDTNPSDPFGVRPDGVITCGGPLAYNVHGQFTFDAGNVLNLEVATWRTDGKALTGPRNPAVSRTRGNGRVLYGGDHRDVNLDGLIDQGETVPALSHSYTVDDISVATRDGGHASICWYPFNHDRWAEDAVQAWDYSEDFDAVTKYNAGVASDVVISSTNIAPLLLGVPLANVVGRAVGLPHASFVAGDDVWIDAITDGKYNASVALNSPTGSIAVGAVGVALVARYQDVDSNSVYSVSADNSWVDANGNTNFDSEVVLANVGNLMNGVTGIPVNEVNTNAVVVYRDNSTGPGYQYGDDVWIENPTVLTTNGIPNLFDPSDMVLLNWGSNLTNGTPSDGAITNAMYHANRGAGELDVGFDLRDDMWIDSTANGAFDCEEVLSRAGSFIYPWWDVRALTNETPGLVFTNVYYLDLDAVAGYQQSGDEAWVSSFALPVFAHETIIAGNQLSDGVMTTYNIPNATYADVNLSSAYEITSDPVWSRVGADMHYAASANIRLPVYMCAFQNVGPAASEAVVPAGDSFSTHHRDGDAPLAGFMHVVAPAEMALLTHEQGHDVQGWPDLYDYDTFDPNGYMNFPVGGFDLMAGGGFVHGVPSLKENAYNGTWVDPVDLTSVLPLNGGYRTLKLYPVERHRNQYYYINNPLNPGERFWFWYQSADQPNPYQNFASVGGQGLHIEHEDIPGRPTALPPQQRINNHYMWQMIQADGLYQMEDGINSGDAADVWPGTTSNRAFTADTIPSSRWWDQTDIGIRIMDVRLPANPSDALEIDIEYHDVAQPWLFPSMSPDTDADGIPDAWEYHYFGSLTVVSAATDWDHDGLSDLGEYLSRTDPRSHAGLSTDATDDADNDGLSNWEEVNVFLTLPTVKDTDDDEIEDGIEVNNAILKPGTAENRYLTSPTCSVSPLVQRSLQLTGAPVTLPGIVGGSGNDRYDLTQWTLDAWYYPLTTNETGVLIGRSLAGGLTNFALRIIGGVPQVDFRTATGHEIVAGAHEMMPTGTWTRVMGIWNPTNQALTLVLNDVAVTSTRCLEGCAHGVNGITTIGQGLTGWMDEFKIWDIPLPVRRPSLRTLTLAETGHAASTNASGSSGVLVVTPGAGAGGGSGGTGQGLFQSMTGGGVVPAGVTAITSTVDGSQQGMGTYLGFPTLPIGATPGDGIILSSGNVADAATTNSSPGTSATLNTPGDPQLDALIGGITHDATSLTLTFTTDATVTGVSFNFLFASEEFPEFIGSVYNDAFAAILDGQNISFDSNGNYISVNNNFFQLDNDPWAPSNPAKIGKAPVSLAIEYDGLTPLLLTSKSPLAPGTHTLKFVIADAGDSVLDSAVFISNFKFSAQGDSGTSVAPGGNTVVIEPEPTNTADIVSWYGFDDGGQTAEDSMHQLDWNYALQGVGSGTVTNKYVERTALPDADGNGLPDWWESLVYGNLTNAVGPATDTDGDGLNDVFEYKCDTNPKNVDTDNDGIWDGNEDADNDGLTNLMEQNLGSDPRLLDTDDDEIGDFAEAVTGSSLIDSTSPLNQKAIYLDGTPGTYLELPPDVMFKLTTWAAQMYIKPMAIGPATLLSRTVQTGVTNYFMALDSNNYVVAGFTAADHSTNISLRSTVPVPTNVWTFVGAGYNDRTGTFEISLNATVNTNMISMKIPAANGVYPENIRVGEGFVGLVDDLRIWYGLPGILDPGLLDGKETGLLAYYRFDDGTSWVNGVDGGGGVSLRADWKTGQVEDMTQKLGWKDGWRNAATLRGAAVFTNLTDATSPFADLDSDGDGLPDWWEIKYGLDPRSAVGINGTWGDPDLDGLNNFDEFRDGVTDPKKFYSLGSSFGDFDSRSSATNLSLTNRPFGSIFNDGDGMLDSWESQYPDLSPLLYDANTDPDGDGWKNYGESRGGSNPESAASYPKPSITFNFTYDGVIATGPIIVNAYNSSGMDGVPNAGLTVPNQVMPFSTTVVAFTRGYLREGKNWFFAFADNDANGAWDTGEPAGIAEGQPVTVGWDVVPPVSIKLTDAAPSGYARFSWPSIAGASSYSVTVRRTTTTGGPIVFTKVISAPRTYIHEGDFQNAGIFGLDDGNSQAPGFQWIVGAVDGTFGMNWATTQSVPTAVWPAGADLAMARNKFQWRMDSSATMFQMQFSTNPAFSVLALDLTTNVPIRRADGISAFVPFDGNSGQLKNGLSYFWRLRSINPYCTSSWMATNSFRLNLQPSGVGASSISGDTFYFGKVTNSSTYKQRIVVEAFTSQGFSGVPSAMTVMTNTGPFTLMGLAPGSYTVRAFFDQNTNNVLDDWESWGFVKEAGIAANDYPPKLLTIPINIGGQKLVIRDRDTDNDKLPDAWEFAHFGNLSAAGPGTLYQSPGYTDIDGDGLSDLHEFELGTDPQKADSDADGMTDGQEATMPGMNPLDPDDDGDGIPTSSEVLWSGAAGYQAGLDLNPSLTDSDGDGVGDLMELAAGSDPLIASSKATVALSKFTASGSNLPILKWNMHSNTRSMKVRYHLMRSADLVTWTEVGTTLSDGTKNIESSITDSNATDRVYYYRLRLTYEP